MPISIKTHQISRRAENSPLRSLRCPAVSWGATSACLAGATPCATTIIASREPWNGWKDWNKRKTLGKEEERKQKKQEFVGESSKFIAMDPASSRALFLPALYYTRKRDSIRFRANLLTTMFFIARLACSAFEAVFQKRQTKFGDLLRWLAEVKERKALRAQAAGLRGVVDGGRNCSRR